MEELNKRQFRCRMCKRATYSPIYCMPCFNKIKTLKIEGLEISGGYYKKMKVQYKMKKCLGSCNKTMKMRTTVHFCTKCDNARLIASATVGW